MTKRELQTKRNRLLTDLRKLTRLRRGQLSKQYYYTKSDNHGRTRRQGPYYVWQSYVNGKKRSVRISRDQVDRVRGETEAYDKFKDLIDELLDVTERLTLQQER